MFTSLLTVTLKSATPNPSPPAHDTQRASYRTLMSAVPFCQKHQLILLCVQETTCKAELVFKIYHVLTDFFEGQKSEHVKFCEYCLYSIRHPHSK